MKNCLYFWYQPVMKTRTLLLITLAVILTSLDCRKYKALPSNILPEATHEGKNTFGCKVDGEIWIPLSKCTFTNNCGEFAVHIGGAIDSLLFPLPIRMSFERYRDGYNTGFHFETPWPQPGITTVGIKTDSLRIGYSTPWSSRYTVSNSRSGFRFEVTHLDTVKRIIAGTFEGTLYNPNSDLVNITEGRFDFQFSFCRCTQ